MATEQRREVVEDPQHVSDNDSSTLETCTEDSGIVDQPCDEPQSPEHCQICNEEDNPLSNTEVVIPDLSTEDPKLDYCLEPRPPHLIEEGSGSPKEVQKKLMRKVDLMSSNGSTNCGCGDEIEEVNEGNTGSIPSRKALIEGTTEAQKPKVFKSLFKRKGNNASTTQTLAASSTTGLIFENRPSSLPAKSLAEQRKHEKQYEEMMMAAKKKELRKAEETLKHEERKKQRDRVVADAQKQWSEVLQKWDKCHTTKKVRELWWFGLPPGVRGTVWKKAIGNELNISHDLYQICLRRCNERLEQVERRSRSDSTKSLSREGSVEVIYLDVQRTFPTLGFFQEGGPYHSTLQDVLGAYACYRPDVGYVQGMSFIAAVLLLNMDASDAFICLANLLNRPSYLAFFRVEHDLMTPYFETYNSFFKENLPRLYAHFTELAFNPEFYLIEWIFTIYTRVLPLDLACRVWDLFCRDGDIFLYRTAIGILKLYHSHLLSLTSIEDIGHFLGHIPDTTDSDILFHHIGCVSISEKKYKNLLSYHQNKHDT